MRMLNNYKLITPLMKIKGIIFDFDGTLINHCLSINFTFIFDLQHPGAFLTTLDFSY